MIPGSKDPLEKKMETHSRKPEKSHEHKSVEPYSPWVAKEMDMTE